MRIAIGDTGERLRPAAGLSEEAESSRIRAELRTDRGDHRRSPAARRAPRILVGDAAQPAGENAAARSLSRSGLHRNAAGGREEREVQEDAGEAVSARRLPVITAHAAPRSVPGIDWYRIRQASLNHFPDTGPTAASIWDAT